MFYIILFFFRGRKTLWQCPSDQSPRAKAYLAVGTFHHGTISALTFGEQKCRNINSSLEWSFLGLSVWFSVCIHRTNDWILIAVVYPVGFITHFGTENPQFLIKGFALLWFDKGTDTDADASGLPGENRVEFPLQPWWKAEHCVQCLFCRACHGIEVLAWLILTVWMWCKWSLTWTSGTFQNSAC